MNAGMNVFQNSKVYAAASNLIKENSGKIRGAIRGIESNKAPPGNTNGKHYSTKMLKINENLEKIISRYKTVNLTRRDNGIIGKEVIRQNALVHNADMHTLGGAYTDHSYVLFESWGDGSFRPLLSIEIAGNEEKIKEIDYVIEQKRRDINILVGGERTRQNFNNNNDANIDQRESTRQMIQWLKDNPNLDYNYIMNKVLEMNEQNE